MKLLWITVITAGTLTVSSACQSGGASNSSPAESDAAALRGSDVVAELSKSVNAGKVKPGDPVKATVTQDVLAHGKIVIRRGSKLVGHVTEVKRRSKEDKESRLGLVFDKALLKGGGEIDFNAAVRALAPGVRIGAVDKPDEMGPPMRMGVNQSSSPQPMSGSSSAGSGRGLNTSSTPAPSGSPKDATENNAAGRAALYSAASHKGGNPETDLMGAGSRGVFGLPDLKLNRDAAGSSGSVITSTRHNVKLDSGTQMVIQVSNR